MNKSPTGPEYWRSLEHLSETPEVREQIQREFGDYNPDSMLELSRRGLLKVMGASLALAGLTLSGCRRWPRRELAPYTDQPEGVLPGVPEQYATVVELAGVASGLLVTAFDGRPIKVEGNPNHPFARTVNPRLGAADAYAQASILEMYDPQRSRACVDNRTGEPAVTTWAAFETFAKEHFAPLRRSGGAGLAFLSEASGSPSVARQKAAILKAYPQARWFEYEPLSRDAEREGARLAAGQPLRSFLHLDKAKSVVLFDADVLSHHPIHLKHSADWSKLRRTADEGQMSRVFACESTFSTTGGGADVRISAKATRIGLIIQALGAALGVGSAPSGLTDAEQRFVDHAAADLKANRGAGVVAVGDSQPAAVHALVLAINQAIGAIGSTLTLLPEQEPNRPTHVEAIRQLVEALNGGQVNTLVILGGNAVYDAPADLDFASALAKAETSIHLSLYINETSLKTSWHLNRAHWLEAWGDATAWDGTVSIAQPLILPLFDGRSIVELLALIAGDETTAGLPIVRATHSSLDDRQWRKALHDGLIEGSANAAVSATINASAIAIADVAEADGFEIRFVVDDSVYDGRFAYNAWLQEAPDPMTKITWDNAALISKTDADKLSIKTGDVIEISAGAHKLQIAAYIMPGQPVGVIALPLGYGHTAGSPIAGTVDNPLGFNAYLLRTSNAMDVATGATVTKTGQHYRLALTQDHHIIDPIGTSIRENRVGRKNESGRIFYEASLEDFNAKGRKAFLPPGHHSVVPLQLFNPPEGSQGEQAHDHAPNFFNYPHAWGMAVDTNACVGCNGCVIACQAENNVPVVGKENVLASREMQWLRIDRYFKGSADDPEVQVVHQPMMCVHCENAPCEQVCPVAATMHDTEGLNVMVYNRCIGTRYCSNNCPYKVRRFNYFDWNVKDPRGSYFNNPFPGIPDQEQLSIDPIRQLGFNPDVTVRMRGVMEKCTYCVQRIQRAKIDRRNKDEEIQDGDVVTACQQACPTQAIVFGNLNDPNSEVMKLHKSKRSYGVLTELNTRPRTLHLAKVRNQPAGTGHVHDSEEHG